MRPSIFNVFVKVCFLIVNMRGRKHNLLSAVGVKTIKLIFKLSAFQKICFQNLAKKMYSGTENTVE